ncbi:PepSY domain-containing protein [Rosistilla oblonga]|uniref:PepSY domain-containing protein n=1 Tax=Rosistilla oblonga TaxID=2527990 RepID=UPI003A971D72
MKALILFAIPGILALIPIQFTDAQSNGGSRMPLIEIVRHLEADGYKPFSEISMDDGKWEVEVRQNDVAYELTVDSFTGKILSQHRDDPDDHPAKDSLPLSEVLKSLAENDGYSDIDEVSFERRYWEVEAFKNRQKRELHVDPRTAKIIADRIDD